MELLIYALTTLSTQYRRNKHVVYALKMWRPLTSLNHSSLNVVFLFEITQQS